VVITALFDEDGALRGFVKLTRDETDRRQAEQIMAQLGRLAETEAMARQIGDTVISSLFKVGLSLEAAVRMVAQPEPARRLTAAVDDIDRAIADIRRIVIFGAPPPD
jgi:signal transduction histidine kinase